MERLFNARRVTVLALFLLESCSALTTTLKEFQPAIVPLNSVTTLTIATADQMNITDNSTLQCRFNDMSMPAVIREGLVTCDTPPMRDTDKVALHLDVDGKLYKAKKPLRFHDPFKVVSISPATATPGQRLSIKIRGITCEQWMVFYVRFQSPDAVKKTQQGACVNETVTCYIPEFPARTTLRVGITLSGRIVEWSADKLKIQYPVDAMKSSLHNLAADTSKKGAFTFKVNLKDKFENGIRLSNDQQASSGLTVQYKPFKQTGDFKFINCDTTKVHKESGSAYKVNCSGAEKEHIMFYPTMNNVLVGGKSAYEVKTTLCPGWKSCAEKDRFPVGGIIGICFGVIILIVFVAALIVWRRRNTQRSESLPSVCAQAGDDHQHVEEIELDVTLVNIKQIKEGSEGEDEIPEVAFLPDQQNKEDVPAPCQEKVIPQEPLQEKEEGEHHPVTPQEPENQEEEGGVQENEKPSPPAPSEDEKDEEPPPSTPLLEKHVEEFPTKDEQEKRRSRFSTTSSTGSIKYEQLAHGGDSE